MKYEMTAVFSQREGLAFNDALAETLDHDGRASSCRKLWHVGTAAAKMPSAPLSVQQAKKYMGTEYRWGGKSGRGIDCSGLVSSAYMQCGVLIYRDAKIVEGWPMHEVAFEDKKPGDALFFPGHVALYLGRREIYPLHRSRSQRRGGHQQP